MIELENQQNQERVKFDKSQIAQGILFHNVREYK